MQHCGTLFVRISFRAWHNDIEYRYKLNWKYTHKTVSLPVEPQHHLNFPQDIDTEMLEVWQQQKIFQFQYLLNANRCNPQNSIQLDTSFLVWRRFFFQMHQDFYILSFYVQFFNVLFDLQLFSWFHSVFFF